jgi:ESCRT-I complex subunit TSG101
VDSDTLVHQVAPGRWSDDQLLKLFGTIPTVVRGTTYHTPIEIWLSHSFPEVPPTIYLKPTQRACLRPPHAPEMVVVHGHPYADASGQVSVPYMAEWNSVRVALPR